MADKPRDRRRPRPPAKPSKALDALTPVLRQFVLEYVGNGENATAAYLAVHPTASRGTASTEGWRQLRRPDVAKALQAELQARFKRLIMSGDEALSRISMDGRADIGEAFDEHNVLLPVRQWPKRLRLSVRAIRTTDTGTEVRLNDALKARELMAINAGKLRRGIDVGLFDLGKYLGETPPDEAPE